MLFLSLILYYIFPILSSVQFKKELQVNALGVFWGAIGQNLAFMI